MTRTSRWPKSFYRVRWPLHSFTPSTVPRDDVLRRLTAHAETDARVLALLVGGSLGRGEGDAFSDLDLIVVVGEQQRQIFIDGARDFMGAAAHIVHWFRPVPALPVFSAITDEWVRCDLTVTVPDAVMGARDTLKPVMDRAKVWDALASTLPSRAPDTARLESIVREFVRVLGLLPVGLGRGDLLVCQTGVGLLRSHLVSLLIEELNFKQPPGALALSRIISPADRQMLEHLPVALPERSSILLANHALAEAFLPRAAPIAFPSRVNLASRFLVRD